MHEVPEVLEGTDPKFDQQYKPIDAGWERVPATTFTKAKVSIAQLSIKEPGYVFACPP